MPGDDYGGFERFLRVGEGRRLKRLRSQAEYIGTLEPELEKLSDDELKGKTAEFRQRVENGEALEDILFEAFATVREAAKRGLGQRPFDVQLMGAIVLHEGDIAEMKTGEGKTLVATMPLYLNSLTGQNVHLVTVNDYLAKRDPNWVKPVYDALGVRAGFIQNLMPFADRTDAYSADITYGTNAEFGFDYLRDNMAVTLEGTVQRGHAFAIVDEVDSILIDEARTPLIISGEPETAAQVYYDFARAVKTLAGERSKQEENVTLATITLQNYFRLYEKLAGMTGTAKTEEKKFVEIYNLHVVEIPTNVEVARDDRNDLIFKTKEAKYDAVLADIKERHEIGQPVLVGTISVEVSEHLSQLLQRVGIPHNVLNAKAHEREAEIIENAQKKVEEQNFVARENVLKYDDVMNTQREVIYAQRRQVLDGADLSDEIKSWIDDVIERLVVLHTEGEFAEDWDLDGLVQAFNALTDAEYTVVELQEELPEVSSESLTQEFKEEALEL